MRYPLDRSRIHFIAGKANRYVLDINSGVFFEVDDLTHDLLAVMCQAASEADAVEQAARKHPKQDVIATLADIRGLVARNELFSPPEQPRPSNGVKGPLGTVCMNVAHNCNLNCSYCFANREGYTQDKTLMTDATARKTIDFLIASSGGLRQLDVSFFGGEPLLNLAVIRRTVDYARTEGRKHGKSFRFHVTTNGTILNEEILEFLASNNFSMIVSLDGPKDVHDSIRQFVDGRGSYDLVVRNLQKVFAVRKRLRHLTIRSTYTRNNLDLSRLAMHLAELGCESVSVEPGFIGPGDKLDLRPEDLPELMTQYDKLADDYLKEMLRDRYFSFFHLKQMMDEADRRKQHIAQCGAATGYVAVGADGKIYPCHKFVGKPEFAMGDVFTGLKRPDIQTTFGGAKVFNKIGCENCWARFICGGGCHYLAVLYNGDIHRPYGLDCELMKRRIELGVDLYCRLEREHPAMHEALYGPAARMGSNCQP